MRRSQVLVVATLIAVVAAAISWTLSDSSAGDRSEQDLGSTSGSRASLEHASGSASPVLSLEQPSQSASERLQEDSPREALKVAQRTSWTPEEVQAHAATPIPELERHFRDLKSQLDEASSPVLWALLREGRAERIAGPGEALQYASRADDAELICGLLSDPALGVFRVVLPRDGHEALYAMRAKVNDLNRHIEDRKSRGER